jgi:hypothetical protein
MSTHLHIWYPAVNYRPRAYDAWAILNQNAPEPIVIQYSRAETAMRYLNDVIDIAITMAPHVIVIVSIYAAWRVAHIAALNLVVTYYTHAETWKQTRHEMRENARFAREIREGI